MAPNKSVGLLTFNFAANMTGFNKAMNKAQKKLKKFGRDAERAGRSLTMGVTLPIIGMAGAALKFGSDLEETNSKFNTVFSSIQKEATETAKVFKDSFGLSELAAKQLLSDTGDLLVGFGFTEKAALDLSLSVNELAVDLASFTNFEGGAEGASLALTKALLGERESIKSLGIAITEADLKSFAADHGLVWKQLDRVQKAQLTYNLAAKQSSKAIGDFARTSDGFANQLRIVKGDLVDVAAEMGMRLIPMAKDVVNWVKKMAKQFDGLSDEQKDSIVKWGLIAAAIGPVLITLGRLSTGLSAFISISKTLFTTSTAGWIALAGVIAMAAKTLYDYLSGANDVASKQDIINGINAQAQTAIIAQRLEVERLTETLEDENSTLEVKEKALNKLQEISPDYYGKLKIAKGDVEGLTEATDAYIDSLLASAKAKAAESRLIGIEEDLLEIAERRRKGREEGEVAYKKQIILTTQNFSALQREKIALLEMIKEREKETKVIKENNKQKTGGPIEITGGGESKIGKQEFKDLSKLAFLYDKVGKLKLNLSTTTLSLDPPELEESKWDKIGDAIEGWVDKWGEKIQKFTDMASTILGSLSDTIGALGNKETVEFENQKKRQEDAMQSAYDKELAIIESSSTTAEQYAENKAALDEKYADKKDALDAKMAKREAAIKTKQAKRDKAVSIMQAIIGTANSVVNALKLPFPFNLAIASLVGGLGAAQIALIASTPIPEFAQGGLVTGPTSAIIGEGIGTTAANPEVVAPLNKLKEYMGGSQQVEVVGKIQGTSIVLSSQKTNINRLRSV